MKEKILNFNEIAKYVADKAYQAFMDKLGNRMPIDIAWLYGYMDSLPENSQSRIAITNMFVAWRRHCEETDDSQSNMKRSGMYSD